MIESTVYIDESGDLGVNKGTRWFVLSAVIVDKNQESSIRMTIDRIRTRLNIREIHITKLREFYKRAYVVKELNNEKFVYMNVLVDTTKFDKIKIPNPLIAYNYVCKYLLQRVSWYLKDNDRKANIVLSARGTSRDGDLIKYIEEKLIPYPDNNIAKGVLGSVVAKSSSSWDLLQLADVCASTTFLAYQVNDYGFRTPCFLRCLIEHLYKKNEKYDSYGLKFFNDSMKLTNQEKRENTICRKNERTPGATTT